MKTLSPKLKPTSPLGSSHFSKQPKINQFNIELTLWFPTAFMPDKRTEKHIAMKFRLHAEKPLRECP